MEEKLIDFITKELNHNNEQHNCCTFNDDFFEKAKNVRVVFYRHHRELYHKLLVFCAENDLIVISTRPATYETILRIEEG